MTQNLLQTDQMKNDAALSEIAPSADTPLHTLFSNLNFRVKEPAMLTVSGVVLSVGNTVVTTGPTGRKKSLSQLNNVDLGDLSGSLDFSTGIGTGIENLTLPTMTSNYYIRFGIEIRANKKVYIIPGIENAVLANAAAPAFSIGALPVGEIWLKDDGTGGQGNYLDGTNTNATQYSNISPASTGGTKTDGLIVGSAADVTAGDADYSSVITAIAAIPSGGKISVLNSYTGAENISLGANIHIEGQGHLTVLGTITCTGDYNSVSDLKHGTVTFNSGSDMNIISSTWLANGSSIVNNGTKNELRYVEE